MVMKRAVGGVGGWGAHKDAKVQKSSSKDDYWSLPLQMTALS